MQTVYYTTQNFIRHTSNVVDLSSYREKLALAQGAPPEKAPIPLLAPRPRARRRTFSRPALALDHCATLAILVMAITVAARFFAIV